MADVKHTELKWEWLDRTLVAGPKQTHLLYAHEAPGLGGQAEDVRRLIAASPDLLSELDVRVGDLVMLRKAIEAGDPKAELLIRVEDMLRETRAAIAKATA